MRSLAILSACQNPDPCVPRPRIPWWWSSGPRSSTPSGALLAARRSAPPALAGRWEFPGGKVDPGETDEQALHREIAEELGVRIELDDRFGGDWPLGSGRVLRLWTAHLAEGTPAPLEDHDELRWLAPGSWLEVPWLPADDPVVAALERTWTDRG